LLELGLEPLMLELLPTTPQLEVQLVLLALPLVLLTLAPLTLELLLVQAELVTLDLAPFLRSSLAPVSTVVRRLASSLSTKVCLVVVIFILV